MLNIFYNIILPVALIVYIPLSVWVLLKCSVTYFKTDERNTKQLETITN